MTKTNNTHPALNSEITDQPAIYCGTYHKYNCGSIAGSWIDLTLVDSKEELYEIMSELHKDEEDPEFMFQDWQSIPDKFIGESWISDEYFEFLEATKDWDDDRKEAYQDFLEYGHDSVKDFEENYQGQFKDEEDFAYDIVQEMIPHDAPEFMKTYFDYEKFARDLFIGDYWISDNGHVFRRF